MAHTRAKQRGSMLVLGAGMVLVLTSFAVLGLDIGRIMIVRNELQNVADAAALAGAHCLPRQSNAGSTTECIEAMATSINWTRAAAKAQEALGRNSAANIAISRTDGGHQIDVGYFNLLTHAPSGGAYNTAFSPLTTNDKPAVRVSVTKDSGVNNGPVAMLTRLIFGSTTDVPMSAEAVAVLSVPSTVPPGTPLLPMVINQCMFNLYWDSTANAPRIYNGPGSTPADPYNLSVVGQPYTIRIGSSYHYPGCAEVGQWTTFSYPSGGAQTVRQLIQGGLPATLTVGGSTNIQPGTVSADYQAVRNTWLGQDVTVVVVNATAGELSSNTTQTVVAFAGFHIDAVEPNGAGGSGFYIQGHFIPANVTAGSSGVGTVFYGTYTPPRLGL